MTRLVCLIPAGGFGSRLGASIPKQYLSLNPLATQSAAHSVLATTIRQLTAVKNLLTIAVCIQANDPHAREVAQLFTADTTPRVLWMPVAQATRAQTVLAGSAALAPQLLAEDWVLVHDAARPFITAALVEQLIDAVQQQADPSNGGLLALPVADTLKRAGSGNQNDQNPLSRVTSTVDRSDLWQAQTPQLFRYDVLSRALTKAREVNFEGITDEASAAEALGMQPLLVAGSARNFKLTTPADLLLARQLWMTTSHHE